mgnify:CR=1 FL=1
MYKIEITNKFKQSLKKVKKRRNRFETNYWCNRFVIKGQNFTREI